VNNKLDTTKEIFADKLELPRDIVLDLPKITIIADNEISVENHKGILLFEEDKIRIKSKVGVISIEGEEFQVLYLEGSTVTVSGNFKAVRYEKNE
jgi:sporulation protein YqfC